jgi:hypothetical protein
MKAQSDRLAKFVLATGIQPSEYKRLTLTEVTAILKELERQRT